MLPDAAWASSSLGVRLKFASYYAETQFLFCVCRVLFSETDQGRTRKGKQCAAALWAGMGRESEERSSVCVCSTWVKLKLETRRELRPTGNGCYWTGYSISRRDFKLFWWWRPWRRWIPFWAAIYGRRVESIEQGTWKWRWDGSFSDATTKKLFVRALQWCWWRISASLLSGSRSSRGCLYHRDGGFLSSCPEWNSLTDSSGSGKVSKGTPTRTNIPFSRISAGMLSCSWLPGTKE